jgi:hypothetical protein
VRREQALDLLDGVPQDDVVAGGVVAHVGQQRRSGQQACLFFIEKGLVPEPISDETCCPDADKFKSAPRTADSKRW